jgi:hypothetical protein
MEFGYGDSWSEKRTRPTHARMYQQAPGTMTSDAEAEHYGSPSRLSFEQQVARHRPAAANGAPPSGTTLRAPESRPPGCLDFTHRTSPPAEALRAKHAKMPLKRPRQVPGPSRTRTMGKYALNNVRRDTETADRASNVSRRKACLRRQTSIIAWHADVSIRGKAGHRPWHPIAGPVHGPAMRQRLRCDETLANVVYEIGSDSCTLGRHSHYTLRKIDEIDGSSCPRSSIQAVVQLNPSASGIRKCDVPHDDAPFRIFGARPCRPRRTHFSAITSAAHS